MIQIDVEGRPAPKGSRIQGRTKAGKAYTYPASKYEAPWIREVAHACEVVMRHRETPPPPYKIDLQLLLHKPNPLQYEWPTGADIDKLARAVLDGLVKGKAIVDDRHITELHATKRFVEPRETPGVRVCIREGTPAAT